ncbi:AAA family ATPase [Sediminivirga luteola]|uniref:AAA family ATPase n=1 Tax=Sediminivirga luteola TaxID=1774748 RepID=UPI001F56D2AD|nr:AAA family ATPase [Sediminivirga luteola]MCI2267150.1 AAA family ATPase [Sediminivirga luteola]
MEHLSEVLKILDGALAHDSRKAVDYANLLAEKLDGDGQARQARAVRTALSKRPVRSFSAAGLRSLPIDDTSQAETIDIMDPVEADERDLVLAALAQEQLDDFLDSVAAFDRWDAEGIAVPNRLLIVGPPGTGKTSLARAIARRVRLPLATTRSDALVSSLLGQTSRNIREVFDFAQAHPCVLFLDEFDALAKMRADSREVGELQRVVIALLQNIDALPESTILIAATNHPELLDRAVWRRFGHQIRLELPRPADRRRLWVHFLGDKFTLESHEVDQLVGVSEGMSPAAIQAAASDMVRSAIRSGMGELTLPLALRRLARTLWDDYAVFDDPATEMRTLRTWQPKVFTVRVLAEMFDVSTRQVTNATREVTPDA